MKSHSRLLAILWVALFSSGAFGQAVNPGRVNVVTTPWSVNWLTHATDAAALTDLGASAWMQTRIGDADAAARLTALGFSPWVQTWVGDANNAALSATRQTGIYNVRHYGAVGDGVTDDTAAIQALIDHVRASALAYGKIYFPPGTYMVSNLHLPAPCHLEGDTMALPILKMITGSTGNMIEDTRDNSAQKVFLLNLQIHGNGCDANGVVVGYNGVQHGGGAHFDNLWIREFQGYGIKANGNACFYHRIDLSSTTHPCKGLFTGTGNQFSQLLHMGWADYGFEITGQNHTFHGIHCEGSYTAAGVLVNGHNVAINGLNVTVDSTVTLPAAIEFASGKFNNSVTDVLVYVETGGVITSLIADNQYSTGRVMQGIQGVTANYRYIHHHMAGRYATIQPGPAAGTAPTAGTNWKGDIQIVREGTWGRPLAWQCLAQGTPGTWAATATSPGAQEKTADYSVVAGDAGTRFSNRGASATVTFTLPALVNGMEYEFVRSANYAVRIDPSGTEVITGGGAGKYLELGAVGSSVRLAFLGSGAWYIQRGYGTITFEP